jgi:hypothetical protein
MDDTGIPLSADIKKSQAEILERALEMSKENDFIDAEYVEDFSANSKKPRWKILQK